MSTDNANPYVGLRSFDIDESLLFFGRNDQIMELLQQLHHYHFVAVVGSSGCGKSSLLRAGVIPALKAGYLIKGSDQWCIGIMRPGQNPLYNLVQIVLEWSGFKPDFQKTTDLLKELEAEGISPLLRLLEEQKQQENRNFFLLVDQFEELFRFTMGRENEAKKDEANDFVNIMLELSRQRRVPFYVVITMRSDFMGDCTKFFGLPEAMNKSLFLVPKLNRVQMKMAIEGPAKLYGGKLSPVFVSRLMNDIAKYEDELPVLQHALRLIWDEEIRVGQSGELDIGDYDYIGGVKEVLSKHADEALASMDKEQFAIAREIFQALTTIDEHGRKTRRPVLLSQLVAMTDASEAELLEIIRRFIADKRSFLIVGDLPDSNDKIIEISHESLIREWWRLNRWVDEEAESASIYVRLAEAATLHQQNKKDFLTGSELQLALDWKNRFKPKAIWAHRYKNGFEEAMSYLDASEKKWIADQRMEDERKKQEVRSKKRLRTMLAGIVALAIIVGIALFTTFMFKRNSEKNEKIAEAATKFASLRDSVAMAAELERDEAKAQLETLKSAQDSIQNIIAQANTDNTTKNRLTQVSTSLNTAIKQSEQDIRRKDLQLKINNEADNPKVIQESLSSLLAISRGKLTPEEMVNVFYFLRRTEKEAWTSALLVEAKKILSELENALNTKEFTMGPQAREQMNLFKSHLREVDYYRKEKYAKKAAN